ncbi:MAG: UbiA family prenyltransferase, partial [Candidatus Methanoperedens sp.]|nr:UbiA family prenyltransferase [Candidatus Methanoperedens sp.]
GLGVKNFVVALTWAFTIVAFIYNFIENYLLGFLIFSFFFFKSFINTVLFDCKDIDGDSIAGLTTIPVYFGEKRTGIILQLINSSFHLTVAAFVLSGTVAFDAIILAYSWVAGLIYISLYANRKKTIFRSVIVHGEWIHMLAFRNLAVQFSWNAFHSS